MEQNSHRHPALKMPPKRIFPQLGLIRFLRISEASAFLDWIKRLGSCRVQAINMPLFWLLGNTMASPGARRKDVLQTCFFDTKSLDQTLPRGLHANYSIDLKPCSSTSSAGFFFWQYLNEAGTVQENHRKLSGGTMPRSPLPRIIQPSKYMQARIQYT